MKLTNTHSSLNRGNRFSGVHIRKVYGYVRFSTDEQKKGHSRERQIDGIRAFAKANNLPSEIEFFEDLGVPAFEGENAKAGQLAAFLTQIEERKVGEGDWLILENLDRLSRQSLEETFLLVIKITKSGVTLATSKDNQIYRVGGFTLETFIRLAIEGELGNRESEKKKQRLLARWEEKRAKAEYKKLTARCPGWLILNDEKTAFTINNARAEVVKRIFRDTANGLGHQQIARSLNIEGVPVWRNGEGWSSTQIADILKSRAVLGEIQFCKTSNVDGKKRRIPIGQPILDYYPRLISETDFYAAQVVIKSRKHERGRVITSSKNLFSKLIVCGYCHGPVHYVNKGNDQIYLRCDRTSRRLAECGPHHWRYADFENSFLDFLVDFDFSGAIENEQSRITSRLLQLGLKEKEASRVLLRQIDAMNKSDQLVDTFIPLIEKAKTELTEIHRETDNLRSHLKNIESKHIQIKDCAVDRPENRFRLRVKLRERIKNITIFFSGDENHPKIPVSPFYRVELFDGTRVDVFEPNICFRWTNGACYEYWAGLTDADYAETLSA